MIETEFNYFAVSIPYLFSVKRAIKMDAFPRKRVIV